MTEMDCNTIFAMLSEHLDGQLPEASCMELERHIRDCLPCVEFVESLRKSVRLCREFQPGVEPPPLPPTVKQSLREAYQRMLAARAKPREV